MSKSLREEIRSVLALSVAAALLSPVAVAQDNQETAAQQTAAEPEEAAPEAEFQEIVVTGSRIRRTEFDSPDPVSVITSERSQLAGLLSTEQILRNTTAAAQGQQVNDSFSGFVTDGGAGANTISLRGLGPQRTLVLVNGKRWSPSGVQGATNSVDLSAIPSSIISRIEILKDGASSIYGADAVAGVINVITKTSLDGVQLNGQGQATHDGGGERYAFDASYGKVGDRGSFSISAQYAEQKALNAADRDWSRCYASAGSGMIPRWTDEATPAPPAGVPRGDGTLDNRDPETGEPLCFGMIYGGVDNFTATGASGGRYRYEPSLTDPYDTTNPYYDPFVALLSNTAGSPITNFTRMPEHFLASNSWPLLTLGNTGNPSSRPIRPYLDNEGAFAYRDTLGPNIANIQTPSKIVSVTSFGQYDFDVGAGTSTAYYEAFWNQRKTEATAGYRQLFPVVNWFDGDGADYHPLNPFAGAQRYARPIVGSWNLQDPTTYVDVARYNMFAGLKGDLAGSWDYDVVVGYGHSDGSYKRENWLNDRVEAAVNGIVRRPDGSVTCSDDVLEEFPDCVPLNLFTEDALLRGIVPNEARAFISAYTKGKTVYEGKSASGYVTGDLFNIPAGAVKAVFGAEWREESIDDQPDEEAIAGNLWGSSSAIVTKGEDSVKELFTEFEVPLLNGKRFAQDLYLSGSLRWTDYDSYGDDTTYKVGLNYQVTPQVLLRSTYGTSFRAPDLYEQFLGDSTGFNSALNDPCNRYGDNYDPGEAVYDNCASQGLDPTYSASSTILTITGGADDLKAETSDSLSIGLVFTPESADVSFAVDYFDIKIENTVESPSIGYILNKCYNSIGLSDPFCTRVGPRSSTSGQLAYVDASFLNIGKQQSRGYDFNFVYEHQFPSGTLTWDGIATYLDKQNYELFGEVTSLEGRWGYPRLSARSQLRYDWRDWRFGWFVDFIGEAEEDPAYDAGTTNQDRQNRMPNVVYHTLSLRYQQAAWEAIATVRNVFDKAPPYASDQPGIEVNRIYNTLPGVNYDLFGRSYVMQLSYKF